MTSDKGAAKTALHHDNTRPNMPPTCAKLGRETSRESATDSSGDESALKAHIADEWVHKALKICILFKKSQNGVSKWCLRPVLYVFFVSISILAQFGDDVTLGSRGGE